MPHPVFGPPSHQLDTVELKLYLPDRRNGYMTRLEVSGRSETSRAALWTVREQWLPPEVEAGLQPADAANHVLLTALQDRPDCQSALERQLAGGGYQDVPLPF